MQWSRLLSPNVRPPARTGKPVACMALAALLTLPSFASAGISFADLVAERNTSPTGRLASRPRMLGMMQKLQL